MVVGDVTTGTDVLIIGAGPGGYVAAIRAGQLDLDVTLVEADAFGGVCLNYGCIPSKALISATDVAHDAGNAERMGVYADPAIDLTGMVGWKDRVVRRLTKGVESLCENAGVELIEGRAEFVDEHTARVVHSGEGQGAETVEFEHAVVATGSRPIEVPGFSFEDEHVLSSKDALSLDAVPDTLVTVGAGYIGMELSTVFRKMGADVTVVEMLDDVLPGYEDDVAKVVRDRAEDLGIEFNFGLGASGYEETDDGIVVSAESEDGDVEEFEADEVLVAVGRRPVTDTMNIDAVGLESNDDGFLDTNEQCRTDVDHVFAIGDVAGEPMLAHQASAEGEVAAEAIAGEPAAMDQRAVPAAVFTDPEIGTVGLTEHEAESEGFDPLVGQFPLRASGRALTMNEREGFVRVVADADDQFLLGAQVVAPEASELIAELGLAIEMGAQLEDVAATIHTHPTLSEAVKEACAKALGRPIHTT
ncbi:MAG: dihydrolipoyl dehydrogenase [Haloarculaceae archaeon]